MDSIINTNSINYDNIMYNFYCWLHDSKYTAVNEVFDAGSTCIQSIINYFKDTNHVAQDANINNVVVNNS